MVYTLLTFLIWTVVAILFFWGQFYFLFKDTEYPNDKKGLPEDRSHIEGKKYYWTKRKISEEEKNRTWR